MLPSTTERELNAIQKDHIAGSIVRYIFGMPVSDRSDIAELIALLQCIQTDSAIDESFVREDWQAPLYTLREYLNWLFPHEMDKALRQQALAFAQTIITTRIDFLRKAQATETNLASYQQKCKRAGGEYKYRKTLSMPLLDGVFDSYSTEKKEGGHYCEEAGLELLKSAARNSCFIEPLKKGVDLFHNLTHNLFMLSSCPHLLTSIPVSGQISDYAAITANPDHAAQLLSYERVSYGRGVGIDVFNHFLRCPEDFERILDILSNPLIVDLIESDQCAISAAFKEFSQTSDKHKLLKKVEEWLNLLLDPNVNTLIRRQQRIKISPHKSEIDSYKLKRRNLGSQYTRSSIWTSAEICNLARIALIPCVYALLESKMITLGKIHRWGEEDTLRMADVIAQPRTQEFFTKSTLNARKFKNHQTLQHSVALFFKFEDEIVKLLGIPDLPFAACLNYTLSESSEEDFKKYIECINNNIFFLRLYKFDYGWFPTNIECINHLSETYQPVIADIQNASPIVQNYLFKEKIDFRYSRVHLYWNSLDMPSARRQTYLAALERTEIREALTDENLQPYDFERVMLNNEACYLTIALRDPAIKATLLKNDLVHSSNSKERKKRREQIDELAALGRLMSQPQLLPLFGFGYLHGLEILHAYVPYSADSKFIQFLVTLSQYRLLFALHERLSDPTLKTFANLGRPDGVFNLQAVLSPLEPFKLYKVLRDLPDYFRIDREEGRKLYENKYQQQVGQIFREVLVKLESLQTSSAASLLFRKKNTADLYVEEYKKLLDFSTRCELNSFYKIGNYFLQKENEERAFSYFTCAHENEADYLDALMQAGNIAYGQQRYDEAVHFLTQAELVSEEKRPGDLRDIRLLLTASKTARDGKVFTLHDASRTQARDLLPDTEEKLLTFR